MAYIPGQGAASFSSSLRDMADWAQQDALLAEQQAAAYAAQQQAQVETHQQQMNAALAQQQDMYDQMLAEQQAILDSARQQAFAPNAAQSQAAQQSSGNPMVDKFLGEYGDRFGDHMATYFNNKALDEFIEKESRVNKWNAAQSQVQRNKMKSDLAALFRDRNPFEVEERGVSGAVWDFGNSAVDSAVTGLMDLAGIAGTYVGKAWNDAGLGDGRLDFSHGILEAADSTRKFFRAARTAESNDSELAFAQAQGLKETLDVLAYDPTALVDHAGQLAGLIFGGKGMGAAVKAGGKATTKAGVTAAVSRGGAVSPAAAQALNISDDIFKSAGVQIGKTTGISGMVQGAGTGLMRVGDEVGNAMSSIGYMSAVEGSTTAADILRQDGLYNAQTGQYNGDALATAGAAGLLTGGLTYGAGRLLPTAEGAASRFLTGGAARAEQSTLGKLVMSGNTTIDDALTAVTKDLQSGVSSRSVAEVLDQVRARLATAEGKAALTKALDGNATLSKVLTGAKPIAGSMLAEGLEEGLIGLISSAASQAVAKDGVFSWDKVNWDTAISDASKAATIGTILGGAVGGIRAASEYRQANETLDSALNKYRERVDAQQQAMLARDQEAANRDNFMFDWAADRDAQVASQAATLALPAPAPQALGLPAPNTQGAYATTLTDRQTADNLNAMRRQYAATEDALLAQQTQRAIAQQQQDAFRQAKKNNALIVGNQQEMVEQGDIDALLASAYPQQAAIGEAYRNVSSSRAARGTSGFADWVQRLQDAEQYSKDVVRNALETDYDISRLRAMGETLGINANAMARISEAAQRAGGYSAVEAFMNNPYNGIGYIPTSVRANIEKLAKIEKVVNMLADEDARMEFTPEEQRDLLVAVDIIRQSQDQSSTLKLTHDWVRRQFDIANTPMEFDRARETELRERSFTEPVPDVKYSGRTSAAEALKPLGVSQTTIKAIQDKINEIKTTSRGKTSPKASLVRYAEASADLVQPTDVELARAQAYAAVETYYANREDDADTVWQMTNEYFLGTENEVGFDFLVNAAYEDALNAATTQSQEVAEGEAKKLGLTHSVAIDASASAAVSDVASAMAKNGKSPRKARIKRAEQATPSDEPVRSTADLFSEPVSNSADLFSEPVGSATDLFSEPVADVQAQFDAEVERVLQTQPKDLFSEFAENEFDYDDFDANVYRYRATPWDKMTHAEQMNAVEQETITRASRALSDAFGKDIMRHIVFVSPASVAHIGRDVSAYVIDGDPQTIYLVAEPTRANHQFVYDVAHEMLHQHTDVVVRGKITKWGDYQQTMDTFAGNKFVQELMGAMQSSYPDLDKYALAEEALAEIHAARTSNNGWAILQDTWGIATKIPTELKAKTKLGIITKTVNWFKSTVARWRGKRFVSDAELAEFFRVVAQGKPTSLAELRTPEAAQRHKAQMMFQAAQQRMAYYHDMARMRIPDFDNLLPEHQTQRLVELATANGDTMTATELGPRVRFAKRKKPDSPNGLTTDNVAPQTAGLTPEQVEQLQPPPQITPVQVPPSDNVAAQQQIGNRLVRQIVIYPKRGMNDVYDPLVHDNYVGIISLESAGNGQSEVRVRMNDIDSGVVGLVHTEALNGDIDGAMFQAWEWLSNTYPDRYTRPYGTAIDPRTGNQLMPHEVHVLNRAQQMGLTSPSVRKWTTWLRNKLPNQFVPVLDKFLDFVSMMRTRWVDMYTPMREVEAMYNQATGQQANIITRMVRDMGEGTAFLHRNFNAGGVMATQGKQQSLRDRTEAVRDAMIAEGVSQEKLNKFIYGLEEVVRYNQFMNTPQSDGKWALDANGQKYLVSNKDGRAMVTVTGFNFKDLNSFNPKDGELDLGGKRFLAALAGMNVDERNRIGRVVAEIAATGRVLADLQFERGILNKADHDTHTQRGQQELAAAFPELAAQGYDFGGFFITMRDETSNAFSVRESEGRVSAVDNVLGNTARLWEAEVKRAFRNNEMAQFALMVISMPNRHFAIEPVTPSNDPADPTGAPTWVQSSKGEMASETVYINGVPVKLVAKSKTAAMMFDTKALHPMLAKVGSLNHFFNQFKTALNPAYPVFGFGRDLMTGYLNISGAIGEQYVSSKDAASVGTKTVGYALRYLFSPDKGNLFYGTWRGKQQDPWAEAYQRLGAGMLFGDDLNTGAFNNINNNPLVGDKLLRSVDVLSSAASKTKSTAARVAETIAYPPETAMRLGAFRAYTEHLFGSQIGHNVTADTIVDLFDQVKNPANSDRAAAIISGTKNLTSNFQQHGTDAIVRNLFSFHNAVMQGTFSTLPQIFGTEHGRKTAAIFLIAAALAAATAIGSEEEDEFGNSKYFQNIHRNRSLIVGDTRIPIPDELGWVKNLGDNVVGVMMGKRNIIDAATDQTAAMTQMVTANQWGQTDNGFTNALFAVTPTMVQPFVAMSSGYDIFGRKLADEYAYDDQGKRIPYAADVERSTHRATIAGTGIAEFLYGATGGGIDMTGDEVDTIGRAYLGGLYHSFTRGQTTAMREGDGMVATIGGELLHNTQAIKIDRQTDEAWTRLGERLNVSVRHAGGTLDVLGAQEDATIGQAQKLYMKADEKSRKAKSDMGFTYKQLNDKIAKAEAEGRYQDARDLRADMRTIRANRDAIRQEALYELNMLGIK